VGIALYDLKTFRIPNILLVFFALIVLISGWKQPLPVIIGRFAAATLAFILFALVWRVSHGMGFGDVKYACLLGYIAGPGKIVPLMLFTALFSVAIYAAGSVLFHWPKTARIPFAPFLSAAMIVSLTGNFV